MFAWYFVIPPLLAWDDQRQKSEFHHTHLELGALGYRETFLFYWSWGFLSNPLKSFFYQSQFIAFGLTILKWYNTWVLEIFFVNIFCKIFSKIFLNIF